MDKERLEELREETTQYRAVADDRCMSTQYEDDILALIDAEIVRQSATDEAVQRALSELGFETLFELESWWWKHGSLAIQALRQYQKPVDGSTSDGHHTFDELYHHRAVLFSALCYAYKDKAWRAKKHHDGSMFGVDWFICGVETPQGQYTYHYRISEYWNMFDCCKTLDNAPEWDGHQPKDVDRLLSLRQMRTEPCEWVVDKWRDGWGNKRQCYVCPDCLKASAVKSKHCPNCGKELVK